MGTKRITAGIGALLLATGIAGTGAGTASADPRTDAGSASYLALFNAGVPVYEVISVDHFPVNGRIPAGSTGADNGNYLHLVRVPNAAAGQPWTVKYAIAGKWLPDEFWLPTDLSGNRLPQPVTNPHPHPYGYGTVFDVVGPLVIQIGPVAIPGVPGSFAGAVAL
ncbi:hypothetical protein ACWDUM_19145 [Rhodococcus sp. NPDC003322]